jgi:hypothetical protein
MAPFAVIWMLPGTVLFILGLYEWWRGRWNQPTTITMAWLLAVLFLAPLFLVYMVYDRIRH